MNTWIIEALDPLLFGDGKPFSAVPGSRARSLPLPTPAPIAGSMRTRHGSDEHGRFDRARVDEVLGLAIHGPIFALQSSAGVHRDWLFPAPADALPLPGPAGPIHRRLRPLDLGAEVRVDDASSVPIGLREADPRKPLREVGPLWSWSRGLRAWLEHDAPLDEHDPTEQGPVAAPRTHVGIDREAGTAEDGALFSTEGRSWVRADGTRLVMSVRTEGAPGDGLGPVGGEGRMARWMPSRQEWPAIPDPVIQSARAGFLRVVLATPAYFEAGDRPSWMLENAPEGSKLVGQANGRALVESGWDYAKRSPKPTRRLVPAGAVYFLALGGSPDERERWARERWLTTGSDTRRTRLDGYGLTMLGAWTGDHFSL